jgi:hypothetical protein
MLQKMKIDSGLPEFNILFTLVQNLSPIVLELFIAVFFRMIQIYHLTASGVKYLPAIVLGNINQFPDRHFP